MDVKELKEQAIREINESSEAEIKATIKAHIEEIMAHQRTIKRAQESITESQTALKELELAGTVDASVFG